MKLHGVVWAGVRTERLAEAAAFFRDVMDLPVHEISDEIGWFKLPNGSEFEIFPATDPDHQHLTTGPVPSFHVDDVQAAVEELRAQGVETWGPWGRPEQGWAHFRAPDGNVYGLSAGAEYNR